MSAAGFKQIECADCTHIEIVEWNRRREIVRRLRRRVHDQIG